MKNCFQWRECSRGNRNLQRSAFNIDQCGCLFHYLVQIVKSVESKWFGVIWDSANLAPTPDPYADLARIAPYAITAQVKVMTRVDGKDTPADFARLVKILNDAKYSGYLIFE